MNKHERVDYLEFPARDIKATKAFFETCFGWQFTDYGPDYSAFNENRLDGGFYRADLQGTTATGSALIVFYSEDLEATLAKVEASGGIIMRSIFSFPGGRRFHFTEPSGNEFSVWTEREPAQG